VRVKTVAIQFIFTSCATSCPTLVATFRDLQRSLNNREHVQFISISVDPEHDRPENLHQFAQQWKVKPGWTMVAGERAAVDKPMLALTGATVPPNGHSSMMLIGREGRWSRAFSPQSGLYVAPRGRRMEMRACLHTFACAVCVSVAAAAQPPSLPLARRYTSPGRPDARRSRQHLPTATSVFLPTPSHVATVMGSTPRAQSKVV
jgi:hypothetical protein